MRKIVIAGFAVLLGFLAAGCQTVTRDSVQQTQKYSRIADLNRRMMNEDIDTLLLLDRPSRLSPWHIRTQ